MANKSALQQAKDMVGQFKNNVTGMFQPGGVFNNKLISPAVNNPVPVATPTVGTEQWRLDESGNTVPRFGNKTTPAVQVQTQPTATPNAYSGIARNPSAKNFNISPTVVDAINKAASYYGIPASILGDIALQESSFDPSKTAAMGGYDGETIDPSTGKPFPYSTSQGLFMINDPTWTDLQNYKNMKGSTLSLPNNNRQDPYTSAMAAAYLIKHGQLGRWNPSANVWGPNYTYEEVQPYYSQTAEADRPSPTIFRQQ